MKMKYVAIAGAAMLVAALVAPMHARGCSRVLYEGAESQRVVGRSLDWKTPIPTNLYVYPRGMHKVGSDRPGAVTWTSQYGAVYAVGYDGGITEGMNEKGLVINGLFCKGAVYDNDSTATRPPISMAMFVGWLLDMNASTAEVVEVLKARNFSLGGATFDGGTVSALHWGVTDATGHSVIFEFNRGDIHIYDMGRYHAMTNDPKWPDMQAIINYWEGIGGQNMLPGSVSSPSRCVRGNYFATHVEKTADAALAVSITRSILVNVSVPYTYAVEGQPNLSSTQWRSYADLKNLRYYFEIVTNPGYYYVDLTTLNLDQGVPVLKLDTQKHTELVGCANEKLHRSSPFTPMY